MMYKKEDNGLHKPRYYDAAWFIAIALCLFLFISRWFLPEFIDNENIYSIHPLKLINPDYLKNDPFMGNISFFTLAYSIISMPFFLSLDSLQATMLMRILIWVFQIWALSRLAKTLGAKWWTFIIFVVLAINIPSRLAGEWLFGSAASKPIAYGFIFLSLDALLKENYKVAGTFSGIAITFHVLSGGWSSLAIFLTIIAISNSRSVLKKTFNYGACAFLMSLPGLLPALFKLFGLVGKKGHMVTTTTMLQSLDINKIYVLFANPFHLDPWYFMKGAESIKAAIIFVLTIVLIRYFVKKTDGRIIITYLIILLSFFVLGITGRIFEIYSILKYYPFRVADAMIPLFMWLGIALMLQKLTEKRNHPKLICFLAIPFLIVACNYSIDAAEPTKKYRSLKSIIRQLEPIKTAYLTKQMLECNYKKHIKREKTEFEEMSEWISKNTPQESLFITPPLEYGFALMAKRPQLVTYKCVPVNEKIIVWKERMEAINGGKFIQNGKSWMYVQLKENYPKLTKNEILKLKEKYGATYLLTTADLDGFQVVHKNLKYILYQIL